MHNAGLLSALVLGLLACGSGDGGTVKKADVERISMTLLTSNAGKPAPQVTCPGDLKAKVGTTMVCSMPIDGKTYDVTMKVTSVDGANAKFDIDVADNPRP